EGIGSVRLIEMLRKASKAYAPLAQYTGERLLWAAKQKYREWNALSATTPSPDLGAKMCGLRLPLRLQCVSLDGRQPLRAGDAVQLLFRTPICMSRDGSEGALRAREWDDRLGFAGWVGCEYNPLVRGG